MARCALNTTQNAFQKAAPTAKPEFRLEETGPCSAILHADNAAGQVAAKMGMEHAIKTAQQKGVAVVGISRMGHSGAISYFVQQAARAGLIGISMCQSDQWWCRLAARKFTTVLTHWPLPRREKATRSLPLIWRLPYRHGEKCSTPARVICLFRIPAVDKNGAPTTDPFAVHALLPAAGPKGYGLMMMIDVLSGVLLGLPFGRQVSSIYDDLHAGRNLGQLHVVINPNFFSSSELFRQHLSQTMRELNAITPAPGFNQVYYPGQDQDIKQRKAAVEGIEIVDDIYQYLISDALYNTSYETKNPFAQ